MEVCHSDWVSQSPAMQRLGQFISARRQAWAMGTPDFERFERELHEHVRAIERECLGAEFARYDVTAEDARNPRQELLGLLHLAQSGARHLDGQDRGGPALLEGPLWPAWAQV